MANEWISDRLRLLKKTKGGLAQALGIDPARVSEIIGGRRNVQVAELPRMAEILEMPTIQLIELLTPRSAPRRPLQLEEGPGDQPSYQHADGFVPRPVDLAEMRQPRNLPVYGTAMGGDDGAFEMNGAIMDYVERPPSLAGSKNAYGVYVQGDSMSPRFEAGWLVHVNPNRPVRRGDNVVIQIKGDAHTAPLAFVKVFEARTASKLLAVQFNPQKPLEWPIEDVVSIHRIVGIAEM